MFLYIRKLSFDFTFYNFRPYYLFCLAIPVNLLSDLSAGIVAAVKATKLAIWVTPFVAKYYFNFLFRKGDWGLD